MKFRNKYRIESTRLGNWDYGWNGAYFVTVCARNGIYFFGKIVETQNSGLPENKMIFSEIGKLANKYWYEIPKHFPFVKTDAFIVMPNHIHGILILENDYENTNNVETLHATSLQKQMQSVTKNEFMSSISPKKNSLSVIMRSYKSAVTKQARRLGYDFSWQPRFFDHIIRNEKSLYKIRNYIVHNPQKWDDDNMNPNNKNFIANKISAKNKKRVFIES